MSDPVLLLFNTTLRCTNSDGPTKEELVDDLIIALGSCVKEKLLDHLSTRPLAEVASLDYIQQVLTALARTLAKTLVDAWAILLAQLGQRIAGTCPGCSRPRACRTRAREPLRLQILGHDIELPKLYLACEHCDAPPVSITRLLTGLSSGDASVELKLVAAYCAAEKSYRAARVDLEVHHGQSVERAKLRRMALEVEKEAMRFAEATRKEALSRLETERRTRGPERLVVEGDGGTTRTGTLVPCEEGDAGFGKTTAKRGLPRRKRDTHFREVITIDVREPGEVEATALDVLVPLEAQEGERARRMLATAARKGLGDNTRVLGLGDMGSSLAPSFAEAFCGHRDSFWLADWHHTCEYVRNAATVLEGIDALAWRKALRAAIYKRDRAQCDTLLDEARAHRVKSLPVQLEKCPVVALCGFQKFCPIPFRKFCPVPSSLWRSGDWCHPRSGWQGRGCSTCSSVTRFRSCDGRVTARPTSPSGSACPTRRSDESRRNRR